MSQVKQAAQQRLASGTRLLGCLAYWNGLTNVRIDRATFRQGFTVCGLGDAVARDPKPEASLNQAAAVAMRRQGRDVAKVKVELKSKTDALVTYCVLAPRDTADLRRDLEEARIVIDRTQLEPVPSIEYESHAGSDIASVIKATIDLYAELRGFVSTQEFSETLMRAMKVGGAESLRTGTYLAPEPAVEKLRMLKTFLETSTSARMTLWEIRDTPSNAAEAKRDAREALTDRLDELITKVKEFTVKTSVDDAQQKSINAHVRQFKDLDARVGLYADILGDYVIEMRKQIAIAKQTLLGKYLGSVEDNADAA